jgi:hypothetical protein
MRNDSAANFGPWAKLKMLTQRFASLALLRGRYHRVHACAINTVR